MADDQTLADTLACQDVVARYFSGADWTDRDMFAAVFWDDATIDFGSFVGGKQDFVSMVMGYRETYARRWHHVGHPRIALDGDLARVEFTCHAIMRNAEAAYDEEFMGRYLMDLGRRGGAWRIERVRYLLHRAATLPLQEPEPPLRTADAMAPAGGPAACG